MPSTTSTSIIAPSHNLTAVQTSPAKSTCPGESIRLIKKCWSSEIGKLNIFSTFAKEFHFKMLTKMQWCAQYVIKCMYIK